MEILVNDSSTGVYTDEEGFFLLPELRPYRPYSISIESRDLDALFVPQTDEGWIEPRPGQGVEYNIPVVAVSGLSGFIENINDIEGLNLNQVNVVLNDDSGEEIKRVRPEFDGFFIIEDIQPGEYELKLDLPENIVSKPDYIKIEIPFDEYGVWLRAKNFELELSE